jgi:hypothetical protein
MVGNNDRFADVPGGWSGSLRGQPFGDALPPTNRGSPDNPAGATCSNPNCKP